MTLLPDEQKKWEFLRDVPVRDAQQQEVQWLARALWAIACLSPWRQWAFSQLALAVCRDLIVYMSDIDRVGREQIDGFTDPYISPLEPLVRGADDCDAKARLFVALCLAVQVPAEMVPRVRRGYLQHVSAKVYLQTPLDRAPRWYPVETILDRARLGDTAEAVPVEIDTHRWAQFTFRDVGQLKNRAA